VTQDTSDWALPIIRDLLLGGEVTRPAPFVAAERALMRLGRWDEAEALAGEVVERFPTEFSALRDWAEGAARRRDWPAALERWQKLRELAPTHFLGLLGTARALREMGKLDEADTSFSEAAERFPGETAVVSEWADCAQRRGQVEQATHRWAMFRERFPDLPLGYTRAVDHLRRIRDFAGAAALVARARLRFPNDRALLTSAAMLAEAQADWETARGAFADLLAQTPGDLAAAEGLVRTLTRLGRHAEAATTLREAIARHPTANSLRFLGVEVALNTEDKAQVVACWRETRAWLLTELDELQAAVA
jgi:tetratricopeptide (TPR) repeat protein